MALGPAKCVARRGEIKLTSKDMRKLTLKEPLTPATLVEKLSGAVVHYADISVLII